MSAEIRKRTPALLTRKLVQYDLMQLASSFPDLVEWTQKRFGHEEITLILRALLEEGISIIDLHSIFENLLSINMVSDVYLSKFIVFAPNTGATCFTYRKKTLDALDANDYSNCLRTSLKRYISYKYARGGNTLVVYLMDPAIEQRIREIDANPLSSDEHSHLIKAINDEVRALPATATNPVVLTMMDIRKTLRKLLEKDFPYLAVLCYQELSPEMNIQPIARISL